MVFLAGLISANAAAAPKKPNILFIFADDQCHQTIGALGNDEIQTPNLDRLATSGVSFRNTYNMGGWNGAVCVASRAMLNTGRMVWRARAAEKTKYSQVIAKGQTWSQLLKKAGYETYMTGKWHVKIKPEEIFDHVVHERPGMPNQTREGYNRPTEGELDVWSPFDQSFDGFWKDGKHWSEVLADDAESFLKNAAKSDVPFFMYLAFNAPHDPRQSPKKYVDMYPQEDIKVPVSYQPLYPYKDDIGCGPGLRDEKLAPFPRSEYAVRVNRQEYYAIISHMDAQIGRILAALEKTGKKDNTYIIFSADHGLACGNHGLIGKQNMYDHSMKPPLIVVGPNIPKNEQREALVYLQDVMATTLDLANVAKPEYVEFNSLLPLIEDAKKASAYDAIYGCYVADRQRMIRVDDMKLIVYPRAKRLRLYNVGSDPLELDDLSSNPEYWKTIRGLLKQLVQLQEDMDDKLDLKTFFPDML
ncbi:MAG: sulfatase-like hydrolase/transferase [Planctomycetes bacterium]|nr:sulfatase-like hydrolase/transferase [Planctomycetota bacterium]